MLNGYLRSTDIRYITVKQTMLPLNIRLAVSASGGVYVTSIPNNGSKSAKIGLRRGDQLVMVKILLTILFKHYKSVCAIFYQRLYCCKLGYNI